MPPCFGFLAVGAVIGPPGGKGGKDAGFNPFPAKGVAHLERMTERHQYTSSDTHKGSNIVAVSSRQSHHCSRHLPMHEATVQSVHMCNCV